MANGGLVDGGSSKKEYDYSLFPLGYRFQPTDEDLIKHYLMKKVEGKELPCNIIRDIDLYSYATPEELSEKFGLIRSSEWYFFTPRYKKYPKGNRPSLSTPGGYWKPTGKDVDVRSSSHGRTLLGKKRRLCFYKGNQMSGENTDWRMHEYRIDNPKPSMAQTMTLDECVLCKVFKHERKKRKCSRTSNIEIAQVPQPVQPQPYYHNIPFLFSS